MYELKIIDFKGKKFEIALNNSLFDKMNFDWNSYNFIDKDYLFLSMREVGCENILNLITYGFEIDFIVRNLKTDEEIMEWEEILELSKNGKLYDGSEDYLVEEGNWFRVEFVKSSSDTIMKNLKEDYNEFFNHNGMQDYLGSYDFYHKPKDMRELIDVLFTDYNEFFNNN